MSITDAFNLFRSGGDYTIGIQAFEWRGMRTLGNQLSLLGDRSGRTNGGVITGHPGFVSLFAIVSP